ncbi:hypothetical protein AFE_2649 [Acidithiobacillus ferrooxidans ATCC 23270]|uniref:Uncharacterized protein n=1 Tax=Acidithiobacillus ferrooxidans (strain ATCC 23270 / DSM 14882 / CIP 104768 / NCIMB 8455) TaxID=243159 RepID=B7J7W3_ACIF2|nr:hypothetical protein AFE_2649 [Acidithiobacillus ferrooxidans ATCC 23270]
MHITAHALTSMTLHQPIAQLIQISAVDFHKVGPTFILVT